MANWKNIIKLRDRIVKQKETKHRKFAMDHYIRFISGVKKDSRLTVQRLKKNGRGCGTAACLAGEVFIMFAHWTKKVSLEMFGYGESAIVICDRFAIPQFAAEKLGLTSTEATHMFHGRWCTAGREYKLASITKAEAIEYLNKAIETKNVMVSIS